MQEALGAYAARAAEKLRRARRTARVMLVFMMTNRFEPETFCEGSCVVHLTVPTDLTPELLARAKEAAARIFRRGCRYRKAGVTLLDLAPHRPAQGGLFDRRDRERAARVMSAVDEINRRMGAGTVRFLGEGPKGARPWHTRCDRRSPGYTTDWGELLTLKG